MNKVAIIDYGMGNLHSVAKAVEHVARESGKAVEVTVSADPVRIAEADRVIFPGVGAIRDCMTEIRRLDVGQMVENAIKSKPVLAICVGMQALMERSEENGGVDCLGFLKGQVKYFGSDLTNAAGQRLKVPHMGWNQVRQQIAHPLWQGIPDNSRFYFVHSYFVDEVDADKVTGVSEYGKQFVATLAADNIFATQFHPEKSQVVGLTLLGNFLAWDGSR
jgi:glutamine amidotransferase